jgi:hypothetical protein
MKHAHGYKLAGLEGPYRFVIRLVFRFFLLRLFSFFLFLLFLFFLLFNFQNKPIITARTYTPQSNLQLGNVQIDEFFYLASMPS